MADKPKKGSTRRRDQLIEDARKGRTDLELFLDFRLTAMLFFDRKGEVRPPIEVHLGDGVVKQVLSDVMRLRISNLLKCIVPETEGQDDGACNLYILRRAIDETELHTEQWDKAVEEGIINLGEYGSEPCFVIPKGIIAEKFMGRIRKSLSQGEQSSLGILKGESGPKVEKRRE